MDIWKHWSFFQGILKDFHHTGAIFPSSFKLAVSITKKVALHRGEPPRVLEVGAGTGVFTERLLEILPKKALLDVYECNPCFVETLRRKVSRACQKVNLYADYVENLPKSASYDYIICGLPFNNFDPQKVRQIFDLLLSSLVEGGYLSFFEYLAIRKLKGFFCCEKEIKRLRSIGNLFREIRRECLWEREIVYRNIPPAVVWHLRKRSLGNGGREKGNL